MGNDNFRKLREVNIVRTDDVPDDLRAAIEDLDPTHVDVVIEVYGRLQESDIDAGANLREGEAGRWINYMFF
jgi:hypothetical protein